MHERRAPLALRGRLLAVLALPLLALMVIGTVADYRQASRVANEAYDHSLASTAVALASRLDDEDGDVDVDLPKQAEAVLRADSVDKVFLLVTDPQGRIRAGDKELLPFVGDVESPTPAFRTLRIGHDKVRVAALRHRTGRTVATVVVAETLLKRERAARQIVVTTILANLAQTLAALAILFFGVRYALRPLDAVSEQVARRSPDKLDPIPDDDAPREIRPLLAAINRLMHSLSEAGIAQRAFISNAAHQLRTPIAGLQTQLELAADSLPAEARPRIARLLAATSKLAHLTHQLLALARSAPEATDPARHQIVALDQLLEEAATDFVDHALARQIDLGFAPAPAAVRGSQWLLKELLANLIDNALQYCPPGAHVTARCGSAADGSAWLEVEDDGPGIPESLRERIFERFFRLATDQEQGSGLGLAIVKEVALRHGAEVQVLTPAGGQGVCFRIRFPQQVLAIGG